LEHPVISTVKRYVYPGVIFATGLLCLQLARADDSPSDQRDFSQQVHSATEKEGVTFIAEYTGEIFANHSGGIKSGATYEGLIRFSLQLDLAQLLCWKGATVYGSMLYPAGEGLTNQYTGDFNRLSNIDAYDSVRLFELWFQQKLFGDLFSIRIGQIAADQEFYQSTTSNLFINSCFGTFPTISFNTNLPIYPVGGLGIRADYRPSSSASFRAAVFDSNPGIQDLNDKHGVAFHLNPTSGVIVIAEGVYQVNPTKENCGIVGTYTIGGYYDSRQYSGDFVHPVHASNGGLYAIIDQVVYRAQPYLDEKSGKQGLSIFTSCGAAPSDRNVVSFYVDCGCNYLGLAPGRENDIAGVAVSYTRLSDELVENGRPIHSGHETVIEATYRLQVNDHLYLQPDVQYIFYPGGFGAHPNALVSGLRFDFTF
jgi:porin